jgi:hypothetical protein
VFRLDAAGWLELCGVALDSGDRNKETTNNTAEKIANVKREAKAGSAWTHKEIK